MIECEKKTQIFSIQKNGFLQVKKGCVIKTPTQILQNHHRGGNETFSFTAELYSKFNFQEISDIKMSLAKKAQSKQNHTKPLNFDINQLIQQQKIGDVKENFHLFRKDFNNDKFIQNYVLIPILVILSLLFVILVAYLCLRSKTN